MIARNNIVKLSLVISGNQSCMDIACVYVIAGLGKTRLSRVTKRRTKIKLKPYTAPRNSQHFVG